MTMRILAIYIYICDIILYDIYIWIYMYIHMIIIYDLYIYMNNIYIYISASDERLAVPPKARFHEPHHGASLPVYADARCR